MAAPAEQTLPQPRPAVHSMPEYHPPLAGRDALRLDFNENPIAPSPRVFAALQALTAEGLTIYPERQPAERIVDNEWEDLRTLYAVRAPHFLRTVMPGLDMSIVRFVPHHVAHAASAYMCAPCESSAVLVADGRGENR